MDWKRDLRLTLLHTCSYVLELRKRSENPAGAPANTTGYRRSCSRNTLQLLEHCHSKHAQATAHKRGRWTSFLGAEDAEYR